MSNRYIEKILKARVYDVANETPLDLANDLTQRFNNQIYLKREDLQPVFSFKLRGAYNKIVQLSDEKKQCGVIAASAGNHAQGVALSAKKLGIKSLIVMPKTTPAIKVKNVKSFGAKIVLHGDNYDEACEHALKLAKEKAMSFVHPYDDPDVIAGQGTIAMEILRQFHNDIHAIFVPVGGGGLISGIASYVKYVRPEIKIIGVEPEDAPSMYKAIESNKRVTLKQVGIFADGVAVKQVGKETFKIAKELVDEILLVNTDEICAAIKDIFDNTRSITEPAGALSVAGLKKYIQREKIENKVLVAIESGANINFDRLRHVAERAEVGEQREALLAVSIPEEPGSFLKFCKTLGKRSITEFNYRFNSKQEAHVFVGVELNSGEAERASIIQHLEEQDYGVINMTDNELAKIHIRYMVGGHAVSVENEVLYRFVFPERPGA
ncbi:MAG: threonine ammonia-lyase, biosynthetic, partial [Methylococcales bacterium]|nr:threonine ammonia-lyase, biosynthetic [Methylococcales bacterium]